MALEAVIVDRLEHINKTTLRRLAKFMRVRRWYALRKRELIVELKWKIDPRRDCGMY